MMVTYYAYTIDGYYKIEATTYKAAWELAPAGCEVSEMLTPNTECLGTLKERSIIAVDIETDGLEHRGGRILEVCMHKLDSRLNIVDTFEGVLPFDPKGFSEFITDMHTKNGLIGSPATCNIKDVRRWLEKYENIVFLGSSVQFDKVWLEHHIRGLDTNHRVIDVSSMKGLVDLTDRLARTESNHRAASDIAWSLELARLYRDVLECS